MCGRGAQVDVERVAEIVVGQVLERRLPQRAGVVHQHVEPAPLLGHAVEGALHRERIGHVVRERQGLAARHRDLLGGLGDAGRVAVDERDLRARLCQEPRGGGADAAARAGHHRHPACEREHVAVGHGATNLVH
jgi:hypothetical protein